MMTEETLKLEMRLSALEYLTCKAYSAMMLAHTGSIEGAKAALDQFALEAGQQMFPGLDPAMSDLANAEWTDAVHRLINLQKGLLEQASPKG